MGSNDLEDIIRKDHKPLPIARRDRHKKTISVTNRFTLLQLSESVKVKVIATYEQWIVFEKKIPRNLKFEDICFSRPKKEDIGMLEGFYLADRELFEHIFFSAFVLFSILRTPSHPFGRSQEVGLRMAFLLQK